MDHHCPWVNNCVGEGNQKFFVLFNLYIFLVSVVGMILSICFFLSCFSEFGMCEYPGSYSATASLINNIFLVSESVFFGLFTSIMSCSQVSAIISDETVTICKNRLITSFGATNASLTSLPSTMLAISAGFESLLFGIFTAAIGGSQLFSICKDETAVESLKRDKGVARPRISKRESLANVFGRPFSWRWFSPFHPPAPLTPVIPPSTTDLGAKDGESSTDGAGTEGHEQQYNDVYLV
ncbi:unnamed protein product [Rodentolepis nana]|uniref:Palmitoyltransferase n=1 Tax=Rodentolepis nana TaxID=102285 RepID=A0A0R3TVU3_RODNA|nr:unnamed protein product [Rodentolepis nana]